jgi:hypothetical protein
MGLLWRLSVVVIILTLAPMQAWAECAWVLWMKDSEIRTQTPWIPVGAFVTQRDCIVGAQQAFDPFRGGGMSALTESGEFSLVTTTRRPGGVVVTVTLQCLPDTIDPRGPKGSGR